MILCGRAGQGGMVEILGRAMVVWWRYCVAWCGYTGILIIWAYTLIGAVVLCCSIQCVCLPLPFPLHST